MTSYRVRIAREAESDLQQIVRYIAKEDSVASAEALLDQMLDVCDSLAENPVRGRYVPELKALGINVFREVLRRPFRIIYEIVGRDVQILVIADGRRKLGTLLQSRLVR